MISASINARLVALEQENYDLRSRLAACQEELDRVRKSESRYRQIFENAPISMLLGNTDGYITEMNGAAEDLYGLTRDQLNQQACRIFDNPQLVENGTLPYLQRALAGEAVVERLTYYDASRDFAGGKFNYGRGHYAPIRNAAGAVDEALRESERRYRTLFELSSEGIYRVEFARPIPLSLSANEQVEWQYRYFRIAEANTAFAELYGYEDHQAVVGMKLTDLHQEGSEKNLALIRRLVEKGCQIRNFESEEIDRHGNRLYLLNNIISDIQGGYVRGIWGSCINITELRKTQETLADERIQAETALIRDRNRIAQDIHDTLAQNFGGILMQLQASSYFAKSNPDKATTHLITARDLAKEGLSQARKSVWSLYEENREYQDLAATIAKVVQQLTTRTEIEVSVAIDGDRYFLDPDMGLNLLRIVQEAIANVVRHAQAQTLTLNLTYKPQQIRLQIRDDGRGFDPSQPVAGFGLTGMQQRCDRLGADFRLTSKVGAGTTIQVTCCIASVRSSA